MKVALFLPWAVAAAMLCALLVIHIHAMSRKDVLMGSRGRSLRSDYLMYPARSHRFEPLSGFEASIKDAGLLPMPQPLTDEDSLDVIADLEIKNLKAKIKHSKV
jgi:hypothetical protein